MRLVKIRPIPLPVFKGGRGWYDDFAVSGASDREYSVNPGAKTLIAGGIKLASTTATVGKISLPTWFGHANFKAEVVVKLVAGTRAVLEFRSLDSNNRMQLRLESNGSIILDKTVLSTGTTLGFISSVTPSAYQCLGLEVCGASIKAFLDGRQIIGVIESDLINNTKISFWCYDAVAGAAESHWQYFAVHPL